ASYAHYLLSLHDALPIFAGIVGMVIALTSDSLLYLVVSWAWAGVGGTLSPAILMTFFWRRYSSAGVIATIIAGFIITIIWISTPDRKSTRLNSSHVSISY